MKLSLATIILATQLIVSVSSASVLSSTAPAPNASAKAESQYLSNNSSAKTKVIECLCEFTPATGGVSSNDTEPVLGSTREEINQICYKMSADRKYAISNCQSEEI
jgi:hypothetical protein